MKELKIEHITTSHGDTFEITDASGNHVTLNPQEALLCLEFLYSNLDEITRLVNDLPKIEQEPAHYNPRIGLEPERDTGEQTSIKKEWWEAHDGE